MFFIYTYQSIYVGGAVAGKLQRSIHFVSRPVESVSIVDNTATR